MIQNVNPYMQILPSSFDQTKKKGERDHKI